MAEKKKHYSVLMSVYYKERPGFLRESMQSVYDQTVPTDDFVLVCDGPLTNELDEVIIEMQKKYGKRLKVIRLEKNGGLGNALNVGINECKNELVARMDSDDISVNNRFEEQLKCLEMTNADVVGSCTIEYDETMNKAIGKREVPEDDATIKQYAKRRNPMNHMSVCYKKTAVLGAGNYLEMSGFEDYYLWVRMINSGAVFHNIQQPLVYVRGGNSMIERRGGLSYTRNIINFEKKLKEVGFISTTQYYRNIVPRITISIAPAFARRIIYSILLRGSKE